MALRAPVDKTEVALRTLVSARLPPPSKAGRMPERGMTYVSVRETVEAAIRASHRAKQGAPRRGHTKP